MPAAAIPVAASLAGPAVGAGLAEFAGATALPAFLTSAVGGALTGGLGSYIMGQDPLKGALFGGIGGGLSGATGLTDKIGGFFGGGADAGEAAANASEMASPEALNAIQTGNADLMPKPGFDYNAPAAASNTAAGVAQAADAAKTGSLTGILGKAALPIGLTLGSLALNQATGTPATGTGKQMGQDWKQPKPMGRTYVPVDPNSFTTASNQRTYFNNVNPQVSYARGGSVRCMANGGGMNDASVGMPSAGMPVNGAGDGMQDKIPAKLSDGEFVVSSPVVSALGNGSNKAGAKKLNKLQANVHKRHFTGGKPKKALGLSSYMQ